MSELPVQLYSLVLDSDSQVLIPHTDTTPLDVHCIHMTLSDVDSFLGNGTFGPGMGFLYTRFHSNVAVPLGSVCFVAGVTCTPFWLPLTSSSPAIE